MWKKLKTEKIKLQQNQQLPQNKVKNSNNKQNEKLTKHTNFPQQPQNINKKKKIISINKHHINDVDNIYGNVNKHNFVQILPQNDKIHTAKFVESSYESIQKKNNDLYPSDVDRDPHSIKIQILGTNGVTKQTNYYDDITKQMKQKHLYNNKNYQKYYYKNQLFSEGQFNSSRIKKAQIFKNLSKDHENYPDKRQVRIQPIMLQTDLSLQQIQEIQNIKYLEQNNKQMDEFFTKIKDAGIDIQDRQSSNRSKDWRSLQYFQIMPKQTINQAILPAQSRVISNNQQKQIKNNNIQQKNKQKDKQKMALKNQTTSQQKTISLITQQSRKLKIVKAKLQQNIKKIRDLNQYLIHVYNQIKEGKKIFNFFLQKTQSETIKKMKDIQKKHEKEMMNKMVKENENQMQELRLKNLSLQGEILQKQRIIGKLNSVIKQLYSKNQELAQNLFQANQKLVQAQLLLQKKIQQFMEKYTGQDRKDKKQNKISQTSQLQIRRLSQEVQQLTRLYQQTQQQHKNALQTQKMMHTIQIQKLARKQTNLHKKQLKLQQKQQKLKQIQLKIKKEKQEIQKKQKELTQIQKILQQKFIKVQQLQNQLNQGYTYMEQIKKQHQQNLQKSHKKYKQLQLRNQQLQQNIHVLKNNRIQQDFGYFRHKNLQQQELVRLNRDANLSKSNQKYKKYDHENNYNNYEIQVENFNNYAREYYPDHTSFKAQTPDRITENYRQKNQVQKSSRDSSKQQHYCDQFGRFLHKSNSGGLGQIYTPEENYGKIHQRIKTYQDQKNHNKFPSSGYDPKYMSQAINSSSYFPTSPKITRNTGLQWKAIREKFDSPNNRNIAKKSSTPTKKSHNYKISQLDSKIQSLRNQIKKQIISTKVKD